MVGVVPAVMLIVSEGRRIRIATFREGRELEILLQVISDLIGAPLRTELNGVLNVGVIEGTGQFSCNLPKQLGKRAIFNKKRPAFPKDLIGPCSPGWCAVQVRNRLERDSRLPQCLRQAEAQISNSFGLFF